MNQFVAWLKSKNITSHTVFGVITVMASAVVLDEQIRTFVLGLFAAHPKIGTAIIAIAGIILKYSTGMSAAGVLKAAPAAQAKLTAEEVKK